MNKPFAIADVSTGVLNALVKKIMRQTITDDAEEAVRLVTSGEWLVIKPRREWRQEDGVIYLEVTSTDTVFSAGWLKWCERRAIGLHGSATDILASPYSEPTRNLIYKVAILKHSVNLPTFGHIRAEASRRQWIEPPIEVACLVRQKFSDWEIQAMGLFWINVMHKPVLTGGVPTILSICSSQEYENFIWVQPNPQDSSKLADAEVGYAYIVPQTTAANI